MVTNGVDLIAAERARQVAEKGRTAGHDALWVLGDASYWKPTPDDRVRELVKAGALIAAEIDRLRALESPDVRPAAGHAGADWRRPMTDTEEEWIPWDDLTPEQQREILEAPCDMRTQEPYPFAWCESHDETFPLGAVCSSHRASLKRAAVAARSRGDFDAERVALDAMALDERARLR